MCGLNLGKIKVCGVKMETRCPLVLAVFFQLMKEVTQGIVPGLKLLLFHHPKLSRVWTFQ